MPPTNLHFPAAKIEGLLKERRQEAERARGVKEMYEARAQGPFLSTEGTPEGGRGPAANRRGQGVNCEPSSSLVPGPS